MIKKQTYFHDDIDDDDELWAIYGITPITNCLIYITE